MLPLKFNTIAEMWPNKIGFLWCQLPIDLRLIKVEVNINSICLVSAERPEDYSYRIIIFIFQGFCQAQPQSQLQLGCSWFYSQLLRQAGRPSGIVLFRPSMTLASKVKLFISIVRLQKYVQTLTLIVLGVI